MISIAFSILVYLCSVCVHIFLHRWLVSIGKVTFASVGVFCIGFFVHAGIAISYLSLPLTSIVLYCLLAVLHIIFFTSPYNNDLGPSITLYFALQKHRVMTEKELLSLLSDEVLIHQRLRDLQSSGLIYRTKNSASATEKGKSLDRLLETYRRLLGWKSSG